MKLENYEDELLRVPFPQPDIYGSLSMPIYHTLAYAFKTAEEMEIAFRGNDGEHTYSRVTNPTVQYFEDRIKAITGAVGVTALNSGMAAISNAVITLAQAGSNIVTSHHLFGNSYSFLVNTIAAFGVEVRFCDLTDPDDVSAHIDENTCAVFVEIITNPQMEVADLKALSVVLREKGVPLVADTTIVPFTSFRAAEFGVDIELISSTKYISGGGTSLGGLIIDYGTFDGQHSPKLREYLQESPSAFHFKLRKEIHRNMGAYMTPEVAYMQSLGLETLAVRYERQASTCCQLAHALTQLEGVLAVHYPGLESSPFYKVSSEQFGKFPGAMLAFDLSSREHCFRFLNNLKGISMATNLFDNRSLILHPASTIYGGFTPEQRELMDVKENSIRLSVGLESADALLQDIKQALEKAR